MLAEVYIENNEMRVINFPKDVFKGKHWKINIEPINEIKDEIVKVRNNLKMENLDKLLLNIKNNLNTNVKKMSNKDLLFESLKDRI